MAIKSGKIIQLLIIVFSSLIISSGLVLYFQNFHDGYADDPGEWSDFATFNTYFLNIVSLIILGYISFITYRTTHYYNLLQIQPLLFISNDKPQAFIELNDTFYVNNGAKNAALNLLVRYYTNRKSKPTKWILCTSLSENQRLELFWVHWADKIEICFTDLTNERFYLYEFSDYEGKVVPIKESEYLKHRNDARNNAAFNIAYVRHIFSLYLMDERIMGRKDMKNYIAEFIEKHLL